VTDAHATYETAIGEGPSGTPVTGNPFDESSYAAADGAAFLVVREGNLVLALSAPDNPATQAALVALAKLALQRAGATSAP